MNHDPLYAARKILEDLQRLPDAAPRDLDATQCKILRDFYEDGEVGLYFFARHMFGYQDLTEDLHLPICSFIGRWGSSVLRDGSVRWDPPTESWEEDVVESYRRLMVCIPRECFKTSLCTRANSLWTVLRSEGHNATVGIFNEKQDNAEAWLAAICQVIERNQLLQTIWRDAMPKGIGYWDKEKGITRARNQKWGSTGILLERSNFGIPELSIEPQSVSGATTGKHYTHKILDDIIGHKAAESEAEMASAIAWVDTSRPLERPAENGNELVVHTPWAYADVYVHMQKKWPGEYKVHRRHILEDPDGYPDVVNGRSIFPNKISTRKAKSLLRTDPFINYAQYMCIPKAGRDTSFNESWFRWGAMGGTEGAPYFRIEDESYDPWKHEVNEEDAPEGAPKIVALHELKKAILLDPAPSKGSELKRDRHAANGIVVVGIDPWGRRYALDCKSLRTGPTEVLYTIMELCEEWGISRVGIEAVNFSAIYAPLWQTICRHEFDWTPEFFELLTAGRDKDSRIRQNLIRSFENNLWYFNRTRTEQLTTELEEFPHGATKDLIDALSYTDESVFRPETEEERRRRVHKKQARDVSRGLTGYGDFQEGM